MEELLNLMSNSYLYKINKSLTVKQVTQIAGDVSRKKVKKFIQAVKCKKKELNGKRIRYSFFIFELCSEPSFLSKSQLIEKSYGYLLMLEYNNYLIVNAKHALGIRKALESVGEPLEYATLSGFLLTEKTAYKRFSLRNTNISSYNASIRKRTIEAKNLADSYAPLNAGKQLVNTFTINTEEGTDFSISLNTSKISERKGKVSFTEYCLWGINLIDKLVNYVPNQNFFQRFAFPSSKEKLKELIPVTLTIDYSSMIEEILTCRKITYTSRNGKERLINPDIILSILNKDDSQIFELIEDKKDTKNFKVETKLLNDVYLKKNLKSLKIVSKKLKNIHVYFEEEMLDFCEFINEFGQILVNFSDIKYAYANKELFFDHQMEQPTQFFLSIFRPYDELSKTTSEKGKIEKEMSTFEDNTLFSFIENTFCKSDYLICDDLGNEIADYISVNENESLDFYHAKSDYKKNLSASAFHVVVSQALKNLASIVNVEKMDLDNKRKVWSNTYSNTNITRMKTNVEGGDVSQAIDVIRKTSLAPSSTKRVWLVIDFLSKKDLENELKKGPNKYTIQIIWLVSAFISDCYEVGVQPRIACKP